MSGDSVELIINNNELNNSLIEANTSGEGICVPFVIHIILGYEQSEIWAVCSILKKVDSSNVYKAENLLPNGLRLVKLTSSVRRVFVLPNLTLTSSTSNSKLRNGGMSFLLRRKDGYPPRQS